MKFNPRSQHTHSVVHATQSEGQNEGQSEEFKWGNTCTRALTARDVGGAFGGNKAACVGVGTHNQHLDSRLGSGCHKGTLRTSGGVRAMSVMHHGCHVSMSARRRNKIRTIMHEYIHMKISANTHISPVRGAVSSTASHMGR